MRTKDRSAHPTSVTLERGMVDLRRGELRSGGAPAVRLTPKERALLAYLASRPGLTIDRQRLLEEVWGYAPDVVSRAVDKTMARLRSKVERVPGRPRHLVSVPGEGYRFEPLASSGAAAAPQHPVHVLFGRSDLLATLRASLAAGPGVWTLHGPGGVGKTSLVRVLLEEWTGPRVGVWLANCTDGASVEATISAALDAPDRDGWAAALAQHDGGLIVLDNAEQVASSVAALLPGLTDAGPTLRILVTSRSSLRTHGADQTVQVPPLKAPAARALLLARARQQGAHVDTTELEALVEVLDGLPLALELAAARLNHATAAELRRRLPHQLGILQDAETHDPPRHHSVAAALAWSWDLLNDEERTILAHCGVFRGGFSLDAAEAILGDRAAWTVLPELVRASLVERRATATGTRFSMHRLVQAFVQARQPAGPGVECAYAAWFAGRSRQWSQQVHAPASAAAWAALSTERANLERAFDIAHRHTQHEVAMDLAAGLQALLRTRGPVSRWHSLTGSLVALTEHGPPALHAQALVFRGVARLSAGDLTASASDLAAGRALALAAGAPAVAAMASIRLAFVRDASGEDGAEALLTEAGDIAASNGLPRIQALAAGDRGIHLWRRGRFAEAEASFATGERLFARSGDAVQRAITAVNRGHNARAQGNASVALLCFQQAAELAEATGYRQVSAVAHLELADLALFSGDREAALGHLDAAETHGIVLGSPELRGVAQARRVVVVGLRTPHAAEALRAARDRLAQVDTQSAEGTWLGLALQSLVAADGQAQAAWLDAAIAATTDPTVHASLRDASAPLPSAHLDRADLRRWQWAARSLTDAAGQNSAES